MDPFGGSLWVVSKPNEKMYVLNPSGGNSRAAAAFAIRTETQAEEYGASSGELKGDIASCKAAIEALTKGLTGSR